MKKSDTHAFVNQLMVFLLFTICSGGSIGLGTVWMRHQISMTANANQRLVSQLAEIDRRLAETSAAIETEQNPVTLRQRNLDLRLGLVPASEISLHPVAGDPVRRLNERVNHALLGGDAAKLGNGIQFRLALGQ